MSKNILVTYATKYGSTAEVAEAIAAALREKQHAVTVQAAQNVTDITPYEAVVLGAPIYIGQWMKEAHSFLKQHGEALNARPLALFALGPTDTDETAMQGAVEQFQNDLAQHDHLNPLLKQVFVGKYDPDNLSLPHRLLAMLPASPLHNRPASDHRDWNAVQAWADEISDHLGD
ncbi:MAG: flavodoxin domain-containing protein [Anaerolineales bacterium]